MVRTPSLGTKILLPTTAHCCLMQAAAYYCLRPKSPWALALPNDSWCTTQFTFLPLCCCLCLLLLGIPFLHSCLPGENLLILECPLSSETLFDSLRFLCLYHISNLVICMHRSTARLYSRSLIIIFLQALSPTIVSSINLYLLIENLKDVRQSPTT